MSLVEPGTPTGPQASWTPGAAATQRQCHAGGTHPAGLGLLFQGLDAAAVGDQVRHQGLMLLQQGLKGVEEEEA